ncbi:uncharacterized protein ARB_01064 [Trichophyton benhamiae CBS 112371]|uniref:Uncharacterized protein n=1 Tax=Arthroderma benhamiae (strain ATCC MYA-4681 / CBS 112371) TaxID=663331 RepID=D4AXZ5_ARTBC|nr:uncharacterized protein ARB_01064 [Trichophyton benhamiae CBS 112371]EFE32173.1 hypothetical protein ARB_01064 [Trichophyton benhamiae CBS 112371]
MMWKEKIQPILLASWLNYYALLVRYACRKNIHAAYQHNTYQAPLRRKQVNDDSSQPKYSLKHLLICGPFILVKFKASMDPTITALPRLHASAPNSTPQENGTNLVGWVDESPNRGTQKLISSCCFTIFICTWVVIHPRVCNRKSVAFLHKLALFLKSIMAPELIAVEGLQEWSQSRKMVRNCEKYTEKEFKLVHAFYISMLGLRYRTERGDKVIWPNQFEWLLENGHMEWRFHKSWGLDESDIKDKSSADGTVKMAALIQAAWFVVQAIVRAAHNLPLAQLESMSLSYIPLFIITYFFWWNKPRDIHSPSVINLPQMTAEELSTFEKMSISNLFDNEGTVEQTSYWNVWALTPRVFEKEAEDKALEVEKAAYEAFIQAQYGKEPTGKENLRRDDNDPELGNYGFGDTRASRSCASLPLAFQPKPRDIVVAHWDPDLYGSKIWPLACLFGASFGALHLISWHGTFPSIAELWLWRASGLASIGSLLVFMHFPKVVFRWGGPLTIISLVSPAVYFLSRIAMIGGVFAALRASDPRIYDTYAILNYWIHLL